MESTSSAGVVKLRIHVSVIAMMSGLWLSVRSLRAVTCSGVSIERALRVQIDRGFVLRSISIKFIATKII